ncbi:MAG: hypothetical protein ACOCXJ_01280 [Planctomycetota bacterium]
MYLIAVLGATLGICALIAYLQEERDATMRTLAGIGLGLGLFFLAWPYVDVLHGDWFPRRYAIFKGVNIAAAVVGVLLVLRANNRVVGTLACAAGSLLALLALGAVRT